MGGPVEISFPLGSYPGATAQEGQGQLINAMAEQIGDPGDKTWTRRRSPGLTQVANAGLAGLTLCRGMRAVGNGFYAAFKDHGAYGFPVAGGTYQIQALSGPLTGSSPAQITFNEKSPSLGGPDVVCVADSVAYLLNTSNVLPYPDANVGSPNSVCFMDGYFIFGYGNSQMLASNLNSTVLNPLNYTTANSRPDNLLRVIPFRGELYAICTEHIEVYQDTAQPTGFPFSRSTVIPRGALSQWSIAGYEPGWNNELAWVTDTKQVMRLDGYQPIRISTHDVERSINSLTQADLINLRAMVYMSEGHAIWQLKSPYWCWCYDFTTERWHQRNSYNSLSERTEVGAFCNDDYLIGETTSGFIYKVDPLSYTEGGNPLVAYFESKPVEGFPFAANYARADFDFIVGYSPGIGDANAVSPTVMISWSDDGGASFSQPVPRPLGPQGKYKQRVSIFRTGRANVQGRVWALSIADPVFVSLIGATCSQEVRSQ